MPILRRDISWEGALAEVVIRVGRARQRILQRNKMPVPSPVVIKAQIDTGSHRCGLDLSVLQALQLPGEVDIEPVFTASTGEEPHPAPVYVVSLTLLGAEGDRSFGDMRVLAHRFGEHEQTKGIIGRDLLDHCLLEYIGHDKRFTLAF